MNPATAFGRTGVVVLGWWAFIFVVVFVSFVVEELCPGVVPVCVCGG